MDRAKPVLLVNALTTDVMKTCPSVGPRIVKGRMVGSTLPKLQGMYETRCMMGLSVAYDASQHTE